jgi:TrmH family RNA methyltransferase
MLTAHTIKILQSLDKKKFRQKYNLFLVEGNKIIRELPDSNLKLKKYFLPIRKNWTVWKLR